MLGEAQIIVYASADGAGSDWLCNEIVDLILDRAKCLSSIALDNVIEMTHVSVIEFGRPARSRSILKRGCRFAPREDRVDGPF